MGKVGRLGKHPPRHDPRTLLMAKYLRPAALPQIPASVDWTIRANPDWGMMQNDNIGDCTCAAAGHFIQTWTANSGQELTIGDPFIVQAYEAVGGYDPNDPSTDRGAVELDVLNFWRKTGFGPDQNKLDAFVALEPGNHAHIQAAINLFGGAYIGLQLPISAQAQDVWSVPPSGTTGNGQPGSWGGHAVAVVGYDAYYLTCITWGEPKRMTWGFWDAYCDEAYALLNQLWLSNGKTPGGFDYTALQQDLAQL